MSRSMLAAVLATAVVACQAPAAHAASGFPVTVTAANGKLDTFADAGVGGPEP